MSLARRHCSNNMVPTRMQLKPVEMKGEGCTIRRVVRNAGSSGGTRQVGSSLNNQQCPATYSTSFTKPRPTRSFLCTGTALPVQQDPSHKPVVLIFAWWRDFLAHAAQSQGDWCVSAPHVQVSYGTQSFLTGGKCRPRACFQRHSWKKGKKFGAKRNCG